MKITLTKEIYKRFLERRMTRCIHVRELYSEAPPLPLDYRKFRRLCKEAKIKFPENERKSLFTPDDIKKFIGLHNVPDLDENTLR